MMASAIENVQDIEAALDNDFPVHFRNYIPRDVNLRQYCLPKPSVKDLEEQIDNHIQRTLEEAKQEDVLTQIVPRRPNWDLKRDVDKKLRILNTRTDKVVLKIIRDEMKQQTTVDEKSAASPEGFRSKSNGIDSLNTDEGVEQKVIDAITALERVDENEDV